MASGPATNKRMLIRRSSSAALDKNSWKQPSKVEELVQVLHLDPHPEGGYYKVTWESDRCSVIDYLMSGGSYSAWHRIRNSEEVWTHHGGDPVIIHMIKDGKYSRTVMGIERFSQVVPAGVWQAAEPVGDNYSLVGCTCIPPFEFSDWEMPKRSELLTMFPEHADVIECLTKEEEPHEQSADGVFY